MQLVPRYLVNNKVALVSNESGFITEYRKVYSRQLQVYRGIDNVLDFRLYNADQRPTDITAYTPKFIAFDENKNMVIEKNGTVLDDGSSLTKGKFTVTITENELLNLKQQYLNYNIYLVDINNDKVLTYAHSNFDNDATIYINAQTFPGPLSTYQVTQFEQTQVDANEWISESITAQPAINGNEALHTAAVYTDSYIGEVIVQATLDNQVTESTSWADVDSLSFVGTETEPTPVNFNGVFSHLRFKTDANPADKITKILVRN
jgi:ribonuclease BN (tRNA processing enzyme)